jgi:succinylarginine dihydrolase
MSEYHYEVNFDGLAGPTHNYSGLAYGNMASMKNKNIFSNPKEAALQCLQKMKFMTQLGLVQGVFPPHERPYLPILRDIGFSGSDHEIIEHAQKEAPNIFYSCCSASPMWTANAAIFTPSTDSLDQHAHFTPANLSSEFHRSFEHITTGKILHKIFNNTTLFSCHGALPSGEYFADEGAANHTRFCKEYGDIGVHLFVYGKYRFKPSALEPVKYPARQSFEATEAIIRQHHLIHDRVILAQQSPLAIDAGIFHNDVISVGNKQVFFYHEKAFVGTDTIIQEIDEKVKEFCDTSMIFIRVSENDIPLEEVVKTYLFNSQLVSVEDNLMAMIAPIECQQHDNVRNFLEKLTKDPNNPIKTIHYLNLKESMNNGGGPACLRLRVVLNQHEVRAIHENVLLSEKLYVKLASWIDKHYRDKLSPKDLADPQLLRESQEALDELCQILKLGSIYSFQQ